MGFAEATGSDGVNRIYMSACFSIYVRIDGNQAGCTSQQVFIASACQPRWKLYWSDPNPGASMSGLRGLTAIPNENVLLVGAEGGGPMSFYSIQPYPACTTPSPPTPSCYTTEYNVISESNGATGMTVGRDGRAL